MRDRFNTFDHDFNRTRQMVRFMFVFVILLKLAIFILNWMLKLFIAWLIYLLAIWMQLPEWAVIALVAISATETRIKYNVTYR